MKRVAVVFVCLALAVGMGCGTYPDEFVRYAGMAMQAALRVWDGIEANPTPVCFAIGTFLLTVIYHKARGKSLRESVEVAATRVTVVAGAVPGTGEDENPGIKPSE